MLLFNLFCSPILSDVNIPFFFKDPRVLDAMLPYLVSYYGNPHSRTHAYGWETEAAVEKARKVCKGTSWTLHAGIILGCDFSHTND